MKNTLRLLVGVTPWLLGSCSQPERTPVLPSAHEAPSAAPPVSVAPPPQEVLVPGCPAPTPTEPAIRFGAEELVPLCRNLYVEAALSREDREHIATDYAAALEDVARGLGPLESEPPLAIVCKTQACQEYFGGPPRRSWSLSPGERLPGATFRAGTRYTILVFSVNARSRGVIAHETVHIEASFRLHHKHVPIWFHEGLAAIVGGEPRCNGTEPHGVDDLRRLEENAAWAGYTNTRGTINGTYCQAWAEVDAWIRRNGKPRLIELLSKVGEGASFDSIYGPMLTPGTTPIPTLIASAAPSLGDGKRPFSLAMWIKPSAQTGVLAHVSETDVGTGWCVPFLGYDNDKHIVSQLFHGEGPDLTSFAVAADPKVRPLHQWTHVAMTWAPGADSKLYVGGALVGEAKAPRYNSSGQGTPMHVAWGSENIGGNTCWHGAITNGSFQGAVAAVRIFDAALGAPEVAALARTPP